MVASICTWLKEHPVSPLPIPSRTAVMSAMPSSHGDRRSFGVHAHAGTVYASSAPGNGAGRGPPLDHHSGSMAQFSTEAPPSISDLPAQSQSRQSSASMVVDAQPQAPSHAPPPASGSESSRQQMPECSPPLNAVQPPTQNASLKEAQRPAPRSYAAAVSDGLPSTQSVPSVSSLDGILQRVQALLHAVTTTPSVQTQLSDASTHLDALSHQATDAVRELQAVRAGLAAAQALQPPMGTPSPPMSTSLASTQGRSLAARTAPAWAPDRCIVLDPPDDALRRRATDISGMGSVLSAALRRVLRPPGDSIVEMLRRTAKGGYCAQLPATCPPSLLQSARALTGIDVAGVRWSCSPLRQTVHPLPSGDTDQRPRPVRRDSFVVAPVPVSMSESDFLQSFIRDNADRLQLSLTALKARLVSASRLTRRLSRGPQAGTWVPSSSVRVQGDPSLVAAIVRTGPAVVDFHLVEVRSYTFAAQHCFHCGAAGHVARHCRGRCHRCDQVHPTEPCPVARTRLEPEAQAPCRPSSSRR